MRVFLFYEFVYLFILISCLFYMFFLLVFNFQILRNSKVVLFVRWLFEKDFCMRNFQSPLFTFVDIFIRYLLWLVICHYLQAVTV